MAPSPNEIELSHYAGPNLTNYEDQIEGDTKWWQSYPSRKFNVMAKAGSTFKNYVGDVFSKSKKLARSASSTNLTYTKEATFATGRPLEKSPSFSCLSPSHINYAYDRYAPRIVSPYTPYNPESEAWYYKSYVPHEFVETHAYREPRSYAPDLYRKWSVPHTKSYLQGYRDYTTGVGLRMMRNIEKIGNYTYRTIDQEVVNHRWTRHAGYGSRCFVSRGNGLPEHPPSQHDYRVYKIRNRLTFR